MALRARTKRLLHAAKTTRKVTVKGGAFRNRIANRLRASRKTVGRKQAAKDYVAGNKVHGIV